MVELDLMTDFELVGVWWQLQVVFMVLVTVVIVLRVVGWCYRDPQNKMLYYPHLPAGSRESVDRPSVYGMPYDELSIPSGGIRLHGYFIKQVGDAQRKSPTVVYFHGNAGNVGHRMPIAAGLYRALGANVVMVDYRGYGHSEGTPTESGLKADARSILEFVHTLDIDHNHVIVMGTSLGGAIGVYLSVALPTLVSGLIIENTFISISCMVDVMMENLLGQQRGAKAWMGQGAGCVFKRLLKPLLLQLNWDTGRLISKVAVPILFLSGRKDELIPPAHMNTLYARARKSHHKALVQFEDGQHNDTWCCEEYFNAIRMFLQRNVLPADVDNLKVNQPFTGVFPNARAMGV